MQCQKIMVLELISELREDAGWIQGQEVKIIFTFKLTFSHVNFDWNKCSTLIILQDSAHRQLL